MTISKAEVEKFFDRYAAAFKEGLNGSLDPNDLRALYSTQFIGAGPEGVRTGDNDKAFGEQMAKGHDNYRQMGTKAITVTDIELYQIDTTHCLARVSWNSACPSSDALSQTGVLIVRRQMLCLRRAF